MNFCINAVKLDLVVCSRTLWFGDLHKKTTHEDMVQKLRKYGEIVCLDVSNDCQVKWIMLAKSLSSQEASDIDIGTERKFNFITYDQD